MEKVIVINKDILLENQRGASILEILLVMGIITIVSPFLYTQVKNTADDLKDISIAKKIMDVRAPALNFVRKNQSDWPSPAQIKLSPEELARITDMAHAGFIDKYTVRGAVIVDIYLGFNKQNAITNAKIANHIGMDAATVQADSVAYSESFAISAPDFAPGDLVYRINYDFTGGDNSKYLHRAGALNNDLNTMERTLYMGKKDIINIGRATAQSARAGKIDSAFIDTGAASASGIYFNNGADMDASSVKFGAVRITGDISGFKNISADKLNPSGFSKDGTIITDRAKINNSITIGNSMNLKSDISKTITGFPVILTHSLDTAFLSAIDITFNNNFGITVSAELLMGGGAPIRVGAWSFPGASAPKFSKFELSRVKIQGTPNSSEFDKIINQGWKNAAVAK